MHFKNSRSKWYIFILHMYSVFSKCVCMCVSVCVLYLGFLAIIWVVHKVESAIGGIVHQLTKFI